MEKKQIRSWNESLLLLDTKVEELAHLLLVWMMKSIYYLDSDEEVPPRQPRPPRRGRLKKRMSTSSERQDHRSAKALPGPASILVCHQHKGIGWFRPVDPVLIRIVGHFLDDPGVVQPRILILINLKYYKIAQKIVNFTWKQYGRHRTCIWCIYCLFSHTPH